MRGRKPTPTATLRLRGSWRANTREGEPELEAAVPQAPEILKGDALAEWDRVSAELGPARVLTRADRAVLAVHCQAWGRMLEAERKVEEMGAVVETPSGLRENPWLYVARKAAEAVQKTGIEFGLTPSSRARVKRVDQAKVKDGKARFFKSAG